MLVCSCSTSRTQPIITTTSFWGKPERKRSLEPGEGVTHPGGGTSRADSVLKHGSPETLMPTLQYSWCFRRQQGGNCAEQPEYFMGGSALGFWGWFPPLPPQPHPAMESELSGVEEE